MKSFSKRTNSSNSHLIFLRETEKGDYSHDSTEGGLTPQSPGPAFNFPSAANCKQLSIGTHVETAIEKRFTGSGRPQGPFLRSSMPDDDGVYVLTGCQSLSGIESKSAYRSKMISHQHSYQQTPESIQPNASTEID